MANQQYCNTSLPQGFIGNGRVILRKGSTAILRQVKPTDMRPLEAFYKILDTKLRCEYPQESRA